MKLEHLSPDAKPIVERFLKRRPHELGAYAFENIALWQPLYTILLAQEEGALCVFFQDALGCFLYLPPLGDDSGARAAKSAYAVMRELNNGSRASRIENVEEADVPLLESAGFVCTLKTNEYVCSRHDMVSLGGNPYKSKRASVNQFLKTAHPTVEMIAARDHRECMALYDRWGAQRQSVARDNVYVGMLFDSRRCLDGLLGSMEKTAWTGRTVRVDGVLKAFTLGYPVSDRIFCVFFEVADLESKGCAQYVFQRFCADLGYEFINIMDDCGLPNLTRVKRSYRPVREAPNFTAVLP